MQAMSLIVLALLLISGIDLCYANTLQPLIDDLKS
jgi:hypothetical protein